MDNQGDHRESYNQTFTIKITKTQKETLNRNPKVAAELREWARGYVDCYDETKRRIRRFTE